MVFGQMGLNGPRIIFVYTLEP